MKPSLPQRILLSWAAAVVLLVLLDIITGDPFWSIWPAWATLMPVAALVGGLTAPKNWFLGAWVGFGLVGSLGLFCIDLFLVPDVTWFFWPVGIWMVVTAVFIGLRVDLIGMVPTSQPANEHDREDRG